MLNPGAGACAKKNGQGGAVAVCGANLKAALSGLMPGCWADFHFRPAARGWSSRLARPNPPGSASMCAGPCSLNGQHRHHGRMIFRCLAPITLERTVRKGAGAKPGWCVTFNHGAGETPPAVVSHRYPKKKKSGLLGGGHQTRWRILFRTMRSKQKKGTRNEPHLPGLNFISQ